MYLNRIQLTCSDRYLGKHVDIITCMCFVISIYCNTICHNLYCIMDFSFKHFCLLVCRSSSFTTCILGCNSVHLYNMYFSECLHVYFRALIIGHNHLGLLIWSLYTTIQSNCCANGYLLITFFWEIIMIHAIPFQTLSLKSYQK